MNLAVTLFQDYLNGIIQGKLAKKQVLPSTLRATKVSAKVCFQKNLFLQTAENASSKGLKYVEKEMLIHKSGVLS